MNIKKFEPMNGKIGSVLCGTFVNRAGGDS